jgi:hypothetical protein
MGQQRGAMQTERDRCRGTAHYRMGSAVQDIRKRLALAFPCLTQVIAYGSRVAVIQDGERAILMEEDIKIDELNVILKEALKAVGFGTAMVRAQRYNDDAIPSNWDRSDMVQRTQDQRASPSHLIARFAVAHRLPQRPASHRELPLG